MYRLLLGDIYFIICSCFKARSARCFHNHEMWLILESCYVRQRYITVKTKFKLCMIQHEKNKNVQKKFKFNEVST